MSRSYRKTSIKDVARRAGVSTTTVSCFVNGREAVCGLQTAVRIRQAIAELNYTPSSLTRGLRQGKTQTIGVCLFSPHDPSLQFGSVFLDRLWRGVVAGADTNNYSLLHYPSSVRNDASSDALLDGRADGVLLMGEDTERAEKLAQAGLPVVLTNRIGTVPEGCGAARANENQTVSLALEHLLALGHRRIAYIAGPVGPHGDVAAVEPVDNVAVQRLTAFCEQMTAEGVFDPDLLGYADSWWGDTTTARVTEQMTRLRHLPHPPTALVCGNDAIALVALTAACALNWKIPDRLSVVGVDDNNAARESDVPLTSIRVPVEEIGRESVACLLRLMAGEPLHACQTVLPVGDLMVRASTARAPK